MVELVYAPVELIEAIAKFGIDTGDGPNTLTKDHVKIANRILEFAPNVPPEYQQIKEHNSSE